MIKLGLVGWPLSHSKSPQLHRAAFKAAGLDGDYDLFPIESSNSNGLVDILDGVRSGMLTGINVTIPYKQTVIGLVDELSISAQSIGAVNTIYQRHGKLIGDNTDAQGFLADLRSQVSDLSTRSNGAIVIGAGGAARAVIWALAEVVESIIVAARNLEKGQRLSSSLSTTLTRRCRLSTILMEAKSLDSIPEQVDLIINTTPVGMYPDLQSSPWPASVAFPKSCFIYDLVYNPAKTKLMEQAKKQGINSANGVGMLVEQAALAFELWTGQPAHRDVMLSAISQTAEHF